MLPARTAAQFEVLLAVIGYSREAKLVTMLASFFAGVDEWIKVREYCCIVLCCGESGSLANGLSVVRNWWGFDDCSGYGQGFIV